MEEVAERTQEILEYQLHDVSPLGHAAFMAVSELCANAIDHGENDLGAFAAVRRVTEPKRQVTIAISDLGMGVPEHIRRRYQSGAMTAGRLHMRPGKVSAGPAILIAESAFPRSSKQR